MGIRNRGETSKPTTTHILDYVCTRGKVSGFVSVYGFIRGFGFVRVCIKTILGCTTVYTDSMNQVTKSAVSLLKMVKPKSENTATLN